jgi:hypothetical protein
MKVTLKNLNKPILTLRGEPWKIVMEEGKPAEQLYIRDVLANLCAMGYDKTKSTDIPRLYSLSLNIMKAKSTLDIEDDELALIKKTIEANKPEYRPFVLGPVLVETGIVSENKKEKK